MFDPGYPEMMPPPNVLPFESIVKLELNPIIEFT
jgi:hypothetical protein